MHFIGLGHSHVVALAKGAYALQARTIEGLEQPFTSCFHYLYDKTFDPPFAEEAGDRVLNPAVAEVLRANEPRFIVLSIGGNEHNVLAIAQGARPFDFILGAQPDLPLDESVDIIPEAAIRETLREWMTEKTDIFSALRQASDRPMIQIEPPPPLPREQVLAYPKEFFKSALEARALSPDTLRYKMWRVQTGLLRQICAGQGVFYIETLPDMMDSTGMLARKAWGADATHANDLYGEAMMAEALRLGVDLDANLGVDPAFRGQDT